MNAKLHKAYRSLCDNAFFRTLGWQRTTSDKVDDARYLPKLEQLGLFRRDQHMDWVRLDLDVLYPKLNAKTAVLLLNTTVLTNIGGNYRASASFKFCEGDLTSTSTGVEGRLKEALELVELNKFTWENFDEQHHT
jgi:hypothetical protein